MKKFLLLSVLALGAVTLNAQDIKVTVSGEEVVSGGTVISYRNDPVLLQFGTLKLDPEVIATVSETADLKITVYNTTKELNTQVQFCWPSQCISIEPGTAGVQEGVAEANNENNLTIDATVFPFDPEEKYTVSCVVEIVANGDEANAFVFNLDMAYDNESGVEGILDEEVDPVYYNLNGCKVENPYKGIYIKKQGNKVTKVIL